MNNQIDHVIQKLNEREIMISLAEITEISKSCECDSAVILKRDYYLGDKCNVILIVRKQNPITIMYRRLSQKLNCQQLDVDKIINLIH